MSNQEKETARSRYRAAAVVAFTIVLMLASLVGLTVIAKKNGRRTVPPAVTTQTVTEKKPRETAPPVTVPPATEPIRVTEPAEVTDDPTPVVNPLPDFTCLPASGSVSKPYSMAVPVFSLTMDDYRTHAGMDFSGEPGDPVVATADGTVGNLWYDPFEGYCISVIHSGGATSIYRNLAEEPSVSVAVGAKVIAGQVIGYIGESSLVECADEPHLHYELQIGNKTVDPADYLPEVRATAADAEAD